MTQSLSSAYTGLATLLTQAGHFISPAELQGVLLGRSSAGSDFAANCLQDIHTYLEEGELTPAIEKAIQGLQAMVQQELTSDAVAVTLLLPSDDCSLAERLDALCQWCQGFLSGFGLVQRVTELSSECLEILQDVSSIALLQTEIAEEDEARSEGDYMELVEYLRLVPVLLYTELNKLNKLNAENAPPTVH